MSTIEILNQIRNKDEYDSILFENELYTFYDSGLTRKVYANSDKTKVIKILINNEGKDYNLEEIEFYQDSFDKSELASTEFRNGIIIQEFCLPVKFSDKELTLKQQLLYSKCRGEVGWDLEGKLVCFDLSEYKKY